MKAIDFGFKAQMFESPAYPHSWTKFCTMIN